MPSGTMLVPLGNALHVCPFGCGTGTVAGGGHSNQTRLGAEKLEALLRYAYDRGLRLFDMADQYGTHPYLARALKGKPRDSFQIVTKFMIHQGGPSGQEQPGADVPVERLLKELQVEYLDLLQIHCVVSPDWNRQHAAQMAALTEFKERGLIRAHGVSCHSFAALETAAGEPWVDVIHVRVNPYGEGMDASPQEVIPVLEKAHASGKGIIGMKLIGEGKFDAEQRRQTIAWAIGLGCVDVLAVGFEKPEEIDEFTRNARAGRQGQFPARESR